jgi:hypothetical protein
MSPNPSRSPYHPKFTRWKAGSAHYTDEAGISQWLDAGNAGRVEVSQHDAGQAIWNTELAAWNKLSVLKGETAWSMITSIGPGRGKCEIDQLTHAIIRHVLTVYKSLPRLELETFDPADTNAGFPLMLKGPGAKIISMALLNYRNGIIDLKATIADGELASQMLGLGAEAAFSFGYATRFGPKYKLDDVLQFTTQGTWAEWGQAKGDRPRKRVVYMAPAAANATVAPLYAWLKSARKQLPGMWHTGPADLSNFAHLTHDYESDISGFDVSVPPELQDAVAQWIKALMPELSDAVTAWRFFESQGLLTASWDLDNTVCALARAEGGTRSGLKLTSELGTLYALIATLRALHQQGYKYYNWPWRPGGDLWVLHLGDDVRASTKRPLDGEAWAEAYAALNLKCELIPGDGFLSRHVSVAGGNAPIAGRIVQQTNANEKEELGEGAEGIGLLGLIARTAGAERLPAELQALTWKAIEHSHLIARLGASGLLEARERARRDPWCLQAIEDALRLVANPSWIATLRRDAEVSLSAKFVYDMIKDHPIVKARSATADAAQRLVAAAADRLSRMPRYARMELVSKAIALGNEDAELLELIMKEVGLDEAEVDTFKQASESSKEKADADSERVFE